MRASKTIYHPQGDADNFKTTEEFLDTFNDGTGTVDLANTGLKVRDSNASHTLNFKPGSNLTADRILTVTTGDADRTLTLGADSSISGTAYVSGGTDVAIADGGTGASTAAAGFDALAPTTTQGDIIYRGASSNSRLAAGTSGQFLQTQGAGANPAWASAGTLLLTSGTVSAAATLDIVLTSYTAHRGLVFVLTNFLPVTDSVNLQVRVSTDGGSTYDSGASDYAWSMNVLLASGSGGVDSSTGSSRIALSYTNAIDGVGNLSTEGVECIVELLNQTSTARWPRLLFRTAYIQASAELLGDFGCGNRSAAQDTDAVRFMFSSGNISAGSYAVYGLV